MLLRLVRSSALWTAQHLREHFRKISYSNQPHLSPFTTSLHPRSRSPSRTNTTEAGQKTGENRRAYIRSYSGEMAKGLRASTRKRNNAKLRATVFGPAYDARTERLSAKLQEIASRPRPDQERVMEVDSGKDNANASPDATLDGLSTIDPRLKSLMLINDHAEMQVDGQKKNTSSASRKAHPSRIEKKKQARKNRSSIVFPTNAQHKKRKAANKKKS